MLEFIALLAVGLAMLALGIWNLRARLWEEGIPAAERLVANALDEAPEPRTAWDRRLMRIQGWAMIVVGFVLAAFAAAALVTFAGQGA